jgi:triosephosphate isomerase
MKMRIPVIAGNWKMYKTRDEALEFIFAVNKKMPPRDQVETVICAPAPLLRSLVKRQGDHLRIGAQNMHEADEGAFTGEISAKLLEELNVSYVIIGHSERRAYYNETDDAINKKIKQALKYDITPILCVGESLEVRQSGQTEDIVFNQVDADLKGLTPEELEKVIIAYEPIWAIGTGVQATNEEANTTIKAIRYRIHETSGEVSTKIRILYGGSVKPETIEGLMQETDIDGALIGGASLIASGFIEMANKTYLLKK